MAIVSKTVVTLRVIGDEVNPSEITQLLGCEPSTSFAKGEAHSYKKDRTPRIAKHGIDGRSRKK